MDLKEFTRRFKISACFCRDFTNKHLIDVLPDKMLFVFSEESSTVSCKEAINILYNNGSLPVWINFYISSFNDKFSVIKITYSEENSKDENHFYHKHEGLPPFHVAGPTVPENWISLEKSGPFEFKPFK